MGAFAAVGGLGGGGGAMFTSSSFTIPGGSDFVTPFFKCLVPGFAGGGGAGTAAATSSSGMMGGVTASVFSTTAGTGGGGGRGSFLFCACAIPTMQTRQTGINIFFINWF